jgi:predicted ATPase
VVVGDLIGAGADQEQAVVGETPNLAARLQAIAEPGAVVISAGTHLLSGGLFDYRDLGPIELKGFGENVPAWQVLGASRVESRFEAQRRGSLTPLVGREEEVDLLLNRWGRAGMGTGQVVILMGEPGIGKSRMTQAIQDRLRGEAHTRLRYFCSPHHQSSALYPFIAQLERAAGFGRDDTPETKLAKLATVLGQATDRLQEIGLIAELLSVPTAGRYPVPPLSPQKRKEAILEALLAQVAGLAAHRPILMLFEDVHWIDPSSLELLSLAVERVATQRVLLVITARPEFTVPWPSNSHIMMLALTRLAPHDGTTLIQQVAGNRTLPDEVMNQLLSRTDGVPLFIEELTRTVLESGLLHEESGAFVLTRPLPLFAIPTTLHASLLARLDRLATARAVAQVGAALGRQFSHELIAAVAQMPEPQLCDSLEQLAASALIYRQGRPPAAEYTFKHALVQDAAYSTLLRSQRRQLHARIAATLEGQFPPVAAGQPEIIARHCTEAGLSDQAIDWWRKAGELALHRSAFASGVAHFKAAIELADGLEDSAAHRLQRLRLQTIYAQALVHAKGQSAPETSAAFTRARELASGVEDAAERFPAYYGLWTGSYNRVDLTSMQELAEAMRHEVRQSPGRRRQASLTASQA